MQLTLIVADPFVEMAIQPAQDYVQTMLDLCPALKQADWQLQAASPTQWMSVQWFNQTQNVTARLLAPHNTIAPFCLLPVHLSMQRDSFSLQALLTLPTHVYTSLTQQLQNYFVDDFTIQADTAARCWWVTPKQTLIAVSPWPQDCLFQSAFAWQPQGLDSQVLRQWGNEIQMLLHQQATTPVLADWPPLLNSLWFASVAEPGIFNPETDTTSVPIMGKGRLYNGWQQGLGLQTVDDWSAFRAGAEVRYLVDDWSQVDWLAIQTAYQRGQIQRLQCIVPFAERSVLVILRRHRRWQFWRKPYSVASLINTLTQQLQSNTLLMAESLSGRA